MTRTGRVLLLGCGLALLCIPELLRRRDPPPEVVKPKTVSKEDCVDESSTVPAAISSAAGMFTEITDEVGLDFHHRVGPLGTYFMPEAYGGGSALFDYDNDGDLDIYLINSGRSPLAVGEFPAGARLENQMYRQEADGRFTDVTAESGLGDTGYGCGCAIADVDNDGDLDIYITNYGPDKLYRNEGNGKFVDVTESAGISDTKWGTCVSFFDYDRDGWLDLFVSNYTSDPFYGHSVGCGYKDGRVSYCLPLKFRPENSLLYHNEGLVEGANGMLVRFRDVTQRAGLASTYGAGFGVVCADFNRDGWPDVYLANDQYPNRLWINRKDGTFVDEGLIRAAAFSGTGMVQAGMGLAIGDIDNDLDLDLFSSHLTFDTSTLYLNDGEGYFEDVTRKANLMSTEPHTGWGSAMIDIDHDGDLDFALANGLVVPCHLDFSPHGEESFRVVSQVIEDERKYWRAYYDTNQLLLNNGSGHFQEVPGGAFTSAQGSARGLAYGDIDNDGDIDLLVTYCGERARLYRNEVEKQGHWLTVRVIDPRYKRDAIGAEVILQAGERKWQRLVQPSSSYLTSNDVRVHFGVGSIAEPATLIVHWPDGLIESFPVPSFDSFITVNRGSGTEVKQQDEHAK